MEEKKRAKSENSGKKGSLNLLLVSSCRICVFCLVLASLSLSYIFAHCLSGDQLAASKKKLLTVSNLLHGLVVTAVVTAIVFMELAGNRDDNDSFEPAPTPPSPSPITPAQEKAMSRPTLRLVIFGFSFVCYLVSKVIEIGIPSHLLLYKRTVDDISLLIGCGSIVSLVFIVTVKFTERVLGPASGVIFFGWIFARLGWLKRFHVWAALKCYRQMKKRHLKGIQRRLAAIKRELEAAEEALGQGNVTVTGEAVEALRKKYLLECEWAKHCTTQWEEKLSAIERLFRRDPPGPIEMQPRDIESGVDARVTTSSETGQQTTRNKVSVSGVDAPVGQPIVRASERGSNRPGTQNRDLPGSSPVFARLDRTELDHVRYSAVRSPQLQRDHSTPENT